MADNLIDLTERVEIGVETTHPESVDFPQTLVAEKIIFCVDLLLVTKEVDDEPLINFISYLLKSYFSLKKKICVKLPEFEFLLVSNNEKIIHSSVNSNKDIQATLSMIKNFDYEEENKPFELDRVFNKIAEIVELPDSKSKKCLPPPWVYHVVWLFGRNMYVPTLNNTNSFDFLMMTPYVALDILYMYDVSLENNQCEEISQALLGLNENEKGYFLSVSVSSKPKMLSCLAQMLGHPLIREPQARAKFNIAELGPPPEPVIINSSEDI